MQHILVSCISRNPTMRIQVTVFPLRTHRPLCSDNASWIQKTSSNWTMGFNRRNHSPLPLINKHWLSLCLSQPLIDDSTFACNIWNTEEKGIPFLFIILWTIPWSADRNKTVREQKAPKTFYSSQSKNVSQSQNVNIFIHAKCINCLETALCIKFLNWLTKIYMHFKKIIFHINMIAFRNRT